MGGLRIKMRKLFWRGDWGRLALPQMKHQHQAFNSEQTTGRRYEFVGMVLDEKRQIPHNHAEPWNQRKLQQTEMNGLKKMNIFIGIKCVKIDNFYPLFTHSFKIKISIFNSFISV